MNETLISRGSKLVASENLTVNILNSFVKNKAILHENAPCPVYKVDGFDGYDFTELGVTDQFLDEAGAYFQKYTNPQHFNALYRIALREIDLNDRGTINILDIGTGGGNSIFALSELLGPERVRALGVDISPQLLELCSRYAAGYGLDADKLNLLCADLYDLQIEQESVDLVAGSSILHHMLDPGPIVELALSALRPGGYAIFTEPFEDGHGILTSAYRAALELEAQQEKKLPADLRRFFEEFLKDFDARKGIGHLREYTKYLDDKWFFTKSWFQDFADKDGCTLKIIPTHAMNDTVFWDTFSVHSKLHNGFDSEQAPPWCKLLVRSLDQSFSIEQKREICFTGVVIMQRR